LHGIAGLYDYRTTFNLTGYNVNTASISGRWSANDNSVAILLNGKLLNTALVNSNTDFSFWLFTIAAGSPFQDGVNTLDFIASNFGDPTGLSVELSGTADLVQVPEPVPEPSTIMLLGVCLIGSIIVAYRRCA
jgi:hypothetical protein